VDLLLVAEEAGGALASVPFIEHVAASRALAETLYGGPRRGRAGRTEGVRREGQAGMEDAVGLAVRVRGSRPDDAGLVGQDHGLDPVAEPELGQQVPDV
jgi:hypothetical protein